MVRAVALCFLALPLSTSEIVGAEPLHVRIDRLIAAKAGGPLGKPSTDAEFLRRLYLDFAGRIPSVSEAKSFLADKSADKRHKLVERLLNGHEYPRRMAELFHVMLMERRGDHDEWRKFLETSFRENKSWNRMVREMLSPDAADEKTRGSAFFIVKRLEKYGQNPTDYTGLTRDIGRLFLGMDLQCAQCHNHLHVDEYKQSMFQGMFAFVGNTFIRRDVKFPAVGVKPLKKKLGFQSVFINEQMMTGPKVPGDKEIAVVSYKRGEEFARPPDRKTRFPGEPKFNTLKLLGERLPRADNPRFARNIANRLWFVMMGHGLVNPLDLHHAGNPPTHPKLLDLLVQELVTRKFDVRHMLRELALTKTYQRTGLLPEGTDDIPLKSYRVSNERPISAEQILRSMLIAVGSGHKPKTESERTAFDKRFNDLLPEFVKIFGNTPRDPEVDFNPSVKSALFVSNSRKVLELLHSAKGNLVDRLSNLPSGKAVTEELYLAILSRRPNADETKTVKEHLRVTGRDKTKAIQQLIWALLSSTEFSVNH